MKLEAVDGASSLGPVLSFLSQWWALNHAVERASKRMQARIGVTAQQRMLLRVIGAFRGIAPGQLARLVHLDPGTISTAVGRLEQAGLVERRRGGGDGRSVSLALTRRGKALDIPDPLTIEGALERTLRRTPRRQAEEVSAFIERFIAELDADRRPQSNARPRRRSAARAVSQA
jgi:DNA-binding MarR family transcriptional regulator